MLIMENAVKNEKSVKDYAFRNNTRAKRYELDLDNGYIALIDYFVTPAGDVALTHTEVPYEFEGIGIGTELVGRCLNDIREQGVGVIPQCGFVASYIRKNPQWQTIVVRRY